MRHAGVDRKLNSFNQGLQIEILFLKYLGFNFLHSYFSVRRLNSVVWGIFIEIYAYHGRSQDFFRGEHFSKILKNLLRISRKCIILAYFSKKLTKHALHFCAFGPKTQCIGHFEEIF